MKKFSDRHKGLLITTLGVLVLTPDALLLRLIDADHWSVLTGRGLINAAVLLVVASFLCKSNPLVLLKRIGIVGWVAGLSMALSNLAFVYSINNTSAANTLVILAVMPFISALLMLLIMKRTLPLAVWLSIVVAMSGICIVFWGQFGGGALMGDLAALAAAVALAFAFVLISANTDLDTLVVTAVGALSIGLVGLVMTGGDIQVAPENWVLVLINGAIILPISFAFITYGPKLISPAEVSLIMMLETILGPIWVWLVLAEQPAQATLYGGALVLLAVIANALIPDTGKEQSVQTS